MTEHRFRSATLDGDFGMLGEIGRGGMGIVYRARDRRTGGEVAVKVIRARYLEDAETVARFEREARTARRLEHRNIVVVHELRRLEDGGLALIMQYVHGGTLKEVIRDTGPLPFATVERVLRDVAAALGHAHARGIIHRDVKPENVFLDESSGHALLADFGIARSNEHESTLTLAGVAIGTPAYMSPEQIDGVELDGRSDLYALGLVGWEMLTARRPWEGENLYGVIYRQKHEDLAPVESLRPDVPPRIAHAITWALMKERRHRPTSSAEFLRQLDTDEPVYSTPVRRSSGIAPPPANADPSRTMKFERPVHVPAGWRDEPEDQPEHAGSPVFAFPAEEPWWRRRAAVVAALVAFPVLLIVAAVATGALSGSDAGDEPLTAVVDAPEAVPIGPTAIDTAAGVTAPADTADPDERLLEPSAPAGWHELRPLGPPPTPPRSPAYTPPAAEPLSQPQVQPRAETIVTQPTPAPAAPIPAPATSVPAGRSDEVAVIAAGGTHSCALTGAGELLCWGGNDRGQLGADGPRRSSPAASVADQRFTFVTAGLGHSCALARSGEAFCWGGNGNGQLGTGTTSASSSPVRVSGGRTFRTISAGVNHSCAIARSGEAYCWGANSAGQIGDGTTVNRSVPVRIAGGGSFVAIAAGRTHSCAVSTQQVVYCWGSNSSGQLGDSGDARPYPAPVTGSLRFVSVVTGNAHSCALTSSGDVYCWGDNAGGQLGDGSTTSRAGPARIAGEVRFSALVAGSMHTCGITRAGEAYCWGRNSYGQIGDGSSSDRTVPVRVRGGHSFRALNASGAHTCGVTTGGEALCWGYNVEGQLGDGSRSHRATPVAVGRPTG